MVTEVTIPWAQNLLCAIGARHKEPSDPLRRNKTHMFQCTNRGMLTEVTIILGSELGLRNIG